MHKQLCITLHIQKKKIMAKGLNQSLFKLIEKRGVTNTMIRVKGLKQENSQVCADYCRN